MTDVQPKRANVYDLSKRDQGIVRAVVAHVLRREGAHNMLDLCTRRGMTPEEFWEAVNKIAEGFGVPAHTFPKYVCALDGDHRTDTDGRPQ